MRTSELSGLVVVAGCTEVASKNQGSFTRPTAMRRDLMRTKFQVEEGFQNEFDNYEGLQGSY